MTVVAVGRQQRFDVADEIDLSVDGRREGTGGAGRGIGAGRRGQEKDDREAGRSPGSRAEESARRRSGGVDPGSPESHRFTVGPWNGRQEGVGGRHGGLRHQ
jgi:hypothetical protein